VQLSVNIDVDNLDRAVAFYQAALGLRPGKRFFENSVAEMLDGPVPIYLLAKEPGSSASPEMELPRDYRRHWTPVHLDFETDDVEAAVAKAVAAGAKLEGGIQSFPGGRFATLSDPFGHGFCLVQPGAKT